MPAVSYLVEREGENRFLVQGEAQGCSGLVRLEAKEKYGEVEDFAGAFTNLRVWAASGQPLPVAQPQPWAWEVSTAADRLYFSYSVSLPPESPDTQWLSRGYCRQGQAFFLGMSLFLGLGAQEAQYRVRFREKTHGTCAAGDGVFFCGNRQELFLSAFLQGSWEKLVVPWKERRLILIRGNPSPLRLESLVSLMPAMFSQLTDLFGGADFRELSFFLFSRDDPGADIDMGTGLSVHRGVLLVFPTQVTRLDLPQHLWLILHESLHQWLGIGLRAGEPGLEWFFEGFTCFFTLILLQRAGLLDEEYFRMVTQINLKAYQEGAHRMVTKEGQPPDARGEFHYRFHGGFFLAWLWDADLKSAKQGDLAGWMQAFYQRHRGGVFDARSLVAALARSSGGRLPEYFYGFLDRTQELPLANVLKYLNSSLP